MITLQNLFDYSKAKGLSSELNGVCDTVKYSWMSLDEVSNNSTRYLNWEFGFKVEFGFEFKPNVWYWFSNMVEDDGSDLNMDLRMIFQQRYNRANGACQRGWKCEKIVMNF